VAAPLSADRLVSALRDEGVQVVERTGWRSNNRNHKGKWDNLNGVVIHHTAGSDSLSLCFNGTTALPGPLCHTHLAKDGTATMVGYGRANHAGTFAQNAHDAVVAESSNHPRPDSSEPVDGNRHYYGIEIENLGNGRDPYPDVQYEAAVRWATAICRAHGWSADSVIGHKEGTRRKIDPTFDMDTFRAEIDERLKHPADWSPGDEEDGLSGITKDDVYNAVWLTDKFTAPDTAADRDTNKTWQPQSYLKDVGNRVRAIDVRTAAQQTTIDELVKVVAQLAANAEKIDADALIARIKGEIEMVTVRLEVADN
jgi:uncharacterized coiled-coil protein SlyX